MARTVEEIKKEFTNKMFKAGDIQFQIKCLETELQVINEDLLELNQEGLAAQKVEVSLTTVKESQ